MPSSIFAPVILPSNNRIVMPQENVDLHVWVGTYEPSFPNYAIAMFISSKGSVGILLKEIAPGFLVKIGSYWQDITTLNNFPEPESMDWLVL